MRIAIDARELAGRATGVGRYVAEILRAWDRQPAAMRHEITLLAHAALPPLGLTNLRCAALVQPGAGGTWWEQRQLPRLIARCGADVLFAPGYTAPLATPIPTVLTVHDVSFCAHPQWFSWREGVRRRTLTRAAARRAAHVLTVSNFSRGEIVRYLGVPESRVTTVYSGVTPLGGDFARAAPTPERLVLYAGSILERRHVPALVRAFAQLATTRPTLRLALAGEARGITMSAVEAAIAESGTQDRIALHGFVDDDALAGLYRRAAAFAFLSSYEGFGLTPLDAIAFGVPPVVLDTPVAREIYGEAAAYVAAPMPDLIAAALDRVVFDDATRRRLLDAGPATLARYSWATCAAQTLSVIERAAGGAS